MNAPSLERTKVLFGLLGTQIDAGSQEDRWNRWRPSVAICQQEDLIIDRFHLLYDRRFRQLAHRLREDVVLVSPETDVQLHEVPMAEPWDFEAVFDVLYDFADAYPFAPETEQYLIHITTGTHVAQICWFLLTESRHIPARLVQTAPPRRDSRPPGSYQIIDLDLSRYDRIATRFHRQQERALSFLKSGIETRNRAFNALMEQIEWVATTSRAPILLSGPTGAGKSRLARRLYELKVSRHLVEGALVEVNCATLRGDGAMSTLFGHRRGAFTGAASDRQGLLRRADQGVLFLDELGELGLDEQAMLLRAIEEKRFLPVGADREQESDFILIAGSNRDLQAEARAGRFRHDLLARLDLWTFRLPGLRERVEDIEPNLDYELQEIAHRQGRKATMNREAKERFLRFATSPQARWQANFRDLNAAVTRMATLAPTGRITAVQVDDEIARLRTKWAEPESPRQAVLVRLLGRDRAAELDRFDRVQLADVVSVCRRSPSLSAAGRRLFAQSRQRRRSVNDADRLRKYLAKFGLDWDAVTAEVDGAGSPQS